MTFFYEYKANPMFILMTQVSILTISEHSRFECLKQLYYTIQSQNYLQIKEWLIVEGSQDVNLQCENIKRLQEFIDERMEQTDITLRLIVPKTFMNFRKLYDIGYDFCEGEIVVHMSDSERHSHTTVYDAVRELKG